VISQLWSWVLLGGGLLVHWLAGSGRSSAWVVGLVFQVLWLAYGIATDQSGFVMSAVLYAVVHARNLARARRTRAAEDATRADTP
jgi:membrane protein implicated in regulation of membrane protease activity